MNVILNWKIFHMQCSDYAPFSHDDYYNKRRGYPSIHALVVCDANFKFTFISAESPGRHHESFIIKSTEIWHFFENNGFYDSILVGDLGFPLRQWLLVPIR